VLSFAGIHPKYPFMLALSQATTERLLARALEAAGGVIERGVRMVECRNVVEGVEVVLEAASGGRREVVKGPWLLAADGVHSIARHQLGIDFVGSSFEREWHLADAPLRTSLATDHAHVFFLEENAFLFMIRVVDAAGKARTEHPVWRTMANRPEPLSHLVQAEQVGPPVWTSSFHISHRINRTLAAGAVYFAGDAAHVHSPLGARGMNLGLEDAFIFAQLVRTDQLSAYDRLRRPVDRGVVRRVEFLSQIASAESRFYRFVRSVVLLRAIKLPFIRARMGATVTGLDHALPQISPV
jgi:2-polyprenyl-6-methoxyphenol hydroxylase-like FAD-dependent oxidoreductase